MRGVALALVVLLTSPTTGAAERAIEACYQAVADACVDRAGEAIPKGSVDCMEETLYTTACYAPIPVPW